MNTNQNHRRFTAEEKYAIIKEGEYGSMSINEVCRKNRISTSLYYQWRKQAQKAMLEGFNSKSGRRKSNRYTEELKAENERLKATLLEITQENVELKKKSLK